MKKSVVGPGRNLGKYLHKTKGPKPVIASSHPKRGSVRKTKLKIKGANYGGW
jgi:hypothetical protein